MLVVDASVAVAVVLAARDLHAVADDEFLAPPLMWSESRSSLHEALWRGDLDQVDGVAAQRALDELPVRPAAHPRLGVVAWKVADELGWAKTYDAEYVALASLLGCRLVTIDARLWRGTRRLGFVVSPAEL